MMVEHVKAIRILLATKPRFVRETASHKPSLKLHFPVITGNDKTFITELSCVWQINTKCYVGLWWSD